jgi:predicted DNA-binding transcriptional regulator YafY
MRRADRLFQIVRLLRVRGFLTGQALADELGVSKRTVYRDIRDLERSGVPIRGEAGVGYRLERGFELPPLTFNEAEIEALVLGARIAGAWGDGQRAPAAGTALQRLEAVLPEPLRRVVATTPLFAPDFHRRRELVAGLPIIREAIGGRRRLRFAYVRADGETSARTVRPFALYFWGKAWTLASWCETRGDYRSFRPDRMSEVVMLESTFDESDGPSLAGFLERTNADREAWWHEPVPVETVVAERPPDERLASPPRLDVR